MTDNQWLRDFVAQHTANLRADIQELEGTAEALRARRSAIGDLWGRVRRDLTDAVDFVNTHCGERVVDHLILPQAMTWVHRWRANDYRFSLRITDYAVKVHWGDEGHQPDSTASYAIHLDADGTALLALNGEVIPEQLTARQLLQPWLEGVLTLQGRSAFG